MHNWHNEFELVWLKSQPELHILYSSSKRLTYIIRRNNPWNQFPQNKTTYLPKNTKFSAEFDKKKRSKQSCSSSGGGTWRELMEARWGETISLWLEIWRVRIRLDLMRVVKDFGRSMPLSLSPISFHILQASFFFFFTLFFFFYTILLFFLFLILFSLFFWKFNVSHLLLLVSDSYFLFSRIE